LQEQVNATARSYAEREHLDQHHDGERDEYVRRDQPAG
jgi:hypothetical protein